MSNSLLEKLIGPFYDVTGVDHRLQVSVDTVRQLVRQHQLLGCPTAEGTLVFPTSQFDEGGAPLVGLAEVVATLAVGTNDPWQVALWLTTPSEQLRGRAPVDALRRGQNEAVRRVACQTAERWRQR